MTENLNRPRFSPTLCLTHDCNLNCIYCYQDHDTKASMSFEVAKSSIDWIFDHVPSGMSGIEIGFIGGEPLLEFELIKEIVSYTNSLPKTENYIFYATTNGTLLTDDMRKWFTEHKECFVLGLSLDGAKETHDFNRCNSFDKIDFNFFLQNWPKQAIKMTLSEYSLYHLAENIKFVHSLGFKEIGGVNLFEGSFDWSSDKYIEILIPQLTQLVDFYVENDSLSLDQMLNRRIDMCEYAKPEKKKWCGIGDGAILFDVDGRRLPCPFVTPMTFSESELSVIMSYDFLNNENFIDNECFNNCYIYPICPHCAGANYLNTKTFKEHEKSKCKIQKLISIFAADLQAKRIVNNPSCYDTDRLYRTIKGIKKIRELYLPEFERYLV